MEVAHRKFGNEWGQFDRYCKLVLYHEAIDYLRELQRKSDHEKPLDALSPEEWDNDMLANLLFHGLVIKKQATNTRTCIYVLTFVSFQHHSLSIFPFSYMCLIYSSHYSYYTIIYYLFLLMNFSLLSTN